MPGIAMKIISFYIGCLSLYILWFLQVNETKDFFRSRIILDSRIFFMVPKFLKITFALVLFVSFMLYGLPRFFKAGYFFMKMYAANILSSQEIWMEDLFGNEAVCLTKGGANSACSLSSDDKTILFCHVIGISNNGGKYSSIFEIDLDSGKIRKVLQDGNFNTGPVYSPDGKLIYFASNEGENRDIWAMDARINKKWKITDDKDFEDLFSLSPDGRWIVLNQKSGAGGHDIYLISTKGGKKTKIEKALTFAYDHVHTAWGPDSNEIAFFSLNKLIIAGRDGELIDRIVFDQMDSFSEIFFHPKDKGYIFFTARPRASLFLDYRLYRFSRKTRECISLKELKVMQNSFDITSDGEKIVYSR